MSQKRRQRIEQIKKGSKVNPEYVGSALLPFAF